MPAPTSTLILTAADVRHALDIGACIDVVEHAFHQLAAGAVIPPGVFGSPVPGGGFHVKTAGIRGRRLYYAAKVNANFPRNPGARGLPTIQGVIALFDAETGELLALMDSIEITGLRTAAASAVAARHLARPDAERLLIIGCGTQGLHHARALLRVRPLSRIQLADRSPAAAERLARLLRTEVAAAVEVVDDFRVAARAADVVVTCTPSTEPLLHEGDLPPSGFIAAVGADSPDKQEIANGALARCAIVADILDQCAEIGELRHAIAGGAMTRDDVRAELSEVVSGDAAGRFSPGETILFDSTGTALEDVAAAAHVYERAVTSNCGSVRMVELGYTQGSSDGAHDVVGGGPAGIFGGG